jgi:hypothetical protein
MMTEVISKMLCKDCALSGLEHEQLLDNMTSMHSEEFSLLVSNTRAR